MRPRSDLRLTTLTTLSTIASLALSQALEAQAGGGGSYGSGSGGGSGGWALYALIRLCIDAPLIGVPIAIVVVIIFVKAQTSARAGIQARSIRRGRQALTTSWTKASTEQLRAVDPSFDTDTFLRRVGTAFQTAQSSWCEQDLKPLRAFVSDAILERFSLQLEEQERDGWRQGMDDIRTGSMAIIHHGVDKHFDTLTVRIPFSARIYRVDRRSGNEIRGSALPMRAFVECWSFLRRRGAQTRDGDGLLGQRCPNCGSALEIVQNARCASCESLVRSGEYDWVLAEITQAIEWKGEDTGAVPGLAAAQERDPDLNAQHLEDRASVIFWRETAAERLGEIDPLSKVATAAFCEDFTKRFEVRGPVRTFTGDRAVGAVKTLGILQGEEWDRAVIEIRWDGRRFRESEKGKLTSEGQRYMRRMLLVLARRAGTQTNIGLSTMSSHCASCGAPDEGGTGHACSYCGAVLNDGSNDWLLQQQLQRIDPEAQSLLQEIAKLPVAPAGAAFEPSKPAAIDIVQWIVQLALEDDELCAKDRAVLATAAHKWHLPASRIDAIVEAAGEAANSGNGAQIRPASDAEAEAWIEHIVELTLADDGRISNAERKLIARAGIDSGQSVRDVQRIVKATRLRLAKESRRAMAESAAGSGG